MSEVTDRLEAGKTLSAMAGNIAANAPVMLGVVLAASVVGGVADTLLERAGNMIGNIILFGVGLFASYTALRTRFGNDPDIQPRGGRVFGINLLSSLGIVLGLILLIVPGVMLFTRWAVAVPAMMRENLGATEALGRSADLTKGARWMILGLGLIIWAPFLLLMILFGGLVGAFAGEAAMGTLWANLIVNLLVITTTVLSSILWVECYVVLSGGEVQKDQLVEIFA
ncbi:MAG TPA: glycerophosphoryl diester phosphodiesterase membrane domain-containing protein [Sphingobium sp.]|uniref:glycerophosphoryl diester phosphodiesterase membrane domain-containing protein n=1 Tax=Sphingobium sp. TaxID=1912891 RepID=UPI002ED0DA83